MVEFQCNFVQARQVITSYSFSGTSGSSSGINVAGQVKTTGGIVKYDRQATLAKMQRKGSAWRDKIKPNVGSRVLAV